jgi:hypothetical protein
MGAAWKPANKQCCSGNRGGLVRKVLPLVLIFRRLRRMRWEQRVVCMGEIINTQKILIGISEEKKLNEDSGVDGTVILKRTNIALGFIGLFHLVEDIGHWPAVVNMVMKSSSYSRSCINKEFTQ